MPELPEVETVLQGLTPAMEGVKISRVDVNRPDLRWPFPSAMAERLTGQTVLKLRRRAKYILADLSSEETLLVHLGMSGRMLISGDPLGQFSRAHPAVAKHDHVIFHMANDSRITFNDPRRFGAMDLVKTPFADQHKLLRSLGPEPLGNDFHENYLAQVLNGRNTAVKSALLDQRIIAGLGNIYVCEVLFRAKISPTQKTSQIPESRIFNLVPVIRNVLTDAIKAGGSSLRDFRQANGELGYFQHSFDVYGREGEPCRTPGCKAQIVRIVQSSRSSFYCATCQS